MAAEGPVSSQYSDLEQLAFVPAWSYYLRHRFCFPCTRKRL